MLPLEHTRLPCCDAVEAARASPVLSSAAEMMRLGLPGSVMSFFTLSS